MTVNHQKPRRLIGLLTPYSGGNLGNSTILAAAIVNVRNVMPGSNFVGITLNPEYTSKRYQIDGFPLAAFSRSYYGQYKSETNRDTRTASRQVKRIVQGIRELPVVGLLLAGMRKLGRELIHIWQATRLLAQMEWLVVPGGGALDEFWGGPWGHPWSLFKWTTLARLCGVPVAFLSVGRSSLERPLSRFFIGNALRHASYRSYRDSESKEKLRPLLDVSRDPVYPDLAFSYPRSNTELQSRAESCDRLRVGVSPIAFCDPRVWPTADEQRYRDYIRRIADLLNCLLAEGHQVVLFATDTPDLSVIDDCRFIMDSSIASSVETIQSPEMQTSDSVLASISRCDVVIASRLHGVILSHLSYVPVLALSYDPKVDAYMRSVGYHEYCLDIESSVECLRERLRMLCTVRRREANNLREIVTCYRERLDEQYAELFKNAYGTGESQLTSNQECQDFTELTVWRKS